MSVVANVAINVDSSNAVSKLKQVQQGAQATQRATADLTTALTSQSGAFSKLQAGAAGAVRSLSGLRGALASIGAGALVAGMVRGAAAAEQLQLRLKLLSREYGETERVQQFVAQSAKTFGQSQVEAAAGVADVYARLRPLGTSLAEIETVYKGFNAVALASGASAEAASGAFLQLSQALGSGRLQGDEFRSVAEQVPGILKLVANEMGVTVGQLKQLGSEGKITSDVLINALAKGFEENKGKISELLALSPAQRFKEFKDSTQALSNAIGSELLPAIVPVVKVATELLRLFGQLPGPMKTIIAAAFGLTAAFVALAPAISTAIGLLGGLSIATLAAAGPWIALAAGIGVAISALASYRSEAERTAGAARGGGAVNVAAANKLLATKNAQIAGLQGQQKTATGRQRGSIDRSLATLRRERGQLQSAVQAGTAATPSPVANAMGTPVGATVGGGGGGRAAGGGADKAASDAKRAAEEAKRLAEQIRQQVNAAESLKIQQQGSLAILRSSNEFEKAFVEFSVKRTEIQRRYSELTLASKSDEERKLLTEARALEFKQSSFELQKQIADLTKQATAPLDDIVSKLKDQVAFEREYGELIKNGTNPELAKQIIEINRAYEASAAALVPALAAAQAAVTRAEAEGASATEIQKYREELERIQAIQSGLPAKKTDAIGAATQLAKPKTTQQLLQEEADAAKLALDKLVEPANMITTAAAGIGDAFATSFKGIVDGSMTAQQGLATFFKSVADMFLDMAAQIIAAWIKMAILNTIVKIFGGGLTTAASPEVGAIGQGSSIFAAAEGAYWPGGFQAFADGGLVTKPTMGLIGEGGESEYVIPASKMQSAMSRYSRGARGEGVIAGSGGGTEGGTATAAAGPMVVDVRYSVERINDVEYVTASAFQAGMRQAAQQGAAQGEQRTLRRLQQSPGTRKRVGM